MSRIDQTAPDQAATAAAQLKDKATDMVDSVKQAATEQYEQARGTAEEYYDRGRESVQQWQHDLETYVQEKPIKALLIAAGAGMVFGMIWKRL